MNRLSESTRARLSILATMVIWGSIGLFRRYIPLPSGLIAEVRALVGAIFLLTTALVRKSPPSLSALRKNGLPLLLSGSLMGFNWILLFEAYRYTSVATATLCYYMAPTLITLLSPIVLRERLTAKKLICLAATLIGMVFVSGILGDSGKEGNLTGVLLGLTAALFYAGVVLTNKRVSGVSPMDRTIAQLSIAAIVLLPYTLLAEPLTSVMLTGFSALMLLIVAIVHTGVAYALYFSSMDRLPAQTVALMSYLDPVVAILLSALALHEPMTPPSIFGALLILSATLLSELPLQKDRSHNP